MTARTAPPAMPADPSAALPPSAAPEAMAGARLGCRIAAGERTRHPHGGMCRSRASVGVRVFSKSPEKVFFVSSHGVAGE